MKTLIAVVVLSLVAGCAVIKESPDTTKLVVQYATLKTIEDSDTITATDVARHIDRVREVVRANDSLTVATLVAEARAPIDFASLSPADRLLLEALLTQIEYNLRDVVGEGVMAEERQVKVLTLLGWMAQVVRHEG